MFELDIKTNHKEEIIDITSRVEDLVKNVKDGVVLVYVPHTTCSLIINENYDPNIQKDFLKALKDIVSCDGWLHDKVDGNGSSHIKSSILGTSQNIIVKDGKLLLGVWQALMFVELDGPRERKIYVKIH